MTGFRKTTDIGEETRIVSASFEGRLLDQLSQLPPEGDLDDALWALLTTFGEPEDGLSIGVCVGSVLGQELVVRRTRSGEPRGYDAVRLFPQHEHEDVLDVPYDDGSTLHVGSPDPLDAEVRHQTEQLAMAIGSIVRRWRLIQELRGEANEARSLRDQAVQSDKLAGLGRMAASIVHELNNPLTSIVAYADFLRKRFEHSGIDVEDRERLGRISEAAGRVLSFSRDLVAYSRPSTATPASVSVHEVIDRALVFCDHLVQESGVSVKREFGQVPPVFGLQGPLTQVFVNLLTNSCQALEGRGGSIIIRTRASQTSNHVVVDVQDTGPGIERDIVDSLFEPYVTTRHDGGGSGLGLNIVQTIVASHGGNVFAKNLGDDPEIPSGAIFSIELPARLAGSA